MEHEEDPDAAIGRRRKGFCCKYYPTGVFIFDATSTVDVAAVFSIGHDVGGEALAFQRNCLSCRRVGASSEADLGEFLPVDC